jgi:3-phenylpropionate/trans-cinnamate dioxygenase ferredoxin subunit
MPITITIKKNGPYLIAGDDVAQVQLVDWEGKPVVPKGKNISLCRCGGSSTKPFCDGTHSKIGFQGAEQAAQQFDAQQGTGQPSQMGQGTP